MNSPAKSPKWVGRSLVRGIARTEASSEETSARFAAEKTPTEAGGARSLLLLLSRLVRTESKSAEEAATCRLLLRLLTCRGLTEDLATEVRFKY